MFLVLAADGTDAYEYAKKINRFRLIKRTEGVSSTDIVGRMLMCTRVNPRLRAVTLAPTSPRPSPLTRPPPGRVCERLMQICCALSCESELFSMRNLGAARVPKDLQAAAVLAGGDVWASE